MSESRYMDAVFRVNAKPLEANLCYKVNIYPLILLMQCQNSLI